MSISISSMLRSYDQYAHPINISFQGNKAHPTILGGILTIFSYILTMIYVISRLNEKTVPTLDIFAAGGGLLYLISVILKHFFHVYNYKKHDFTLLEEFMRL